MARKQLKDETMKRVNARVKTSFAPSGKVGKNGRYGIRTSNSDFALFWKAACLRRAERFNRQNKKIKKAGRT